MKLSDRSPWWWITAMLSPLGIFGGTLALASMLKGVIQWQGLTAFLVHYWSEFVSSPISVIFGQIAYLLSVPEPPIWITDYLIFGIIIAGRYFVAWTTVNTPQVTGDLPRWIKFIRHIFFWPYSIAVTIISVLRNGVMSWAGLLLTFGPIVLLFILWSINMLYAGSAEPKTF